MSCRISKVRYKNGTELTILPPSTNNIRVFDIGWGSVTFRLYDDSNITNETMVYMMEAIKDTIIRGEE